jgi:hypothetical protein
MNRYRDFLYLMSYMRMKIGRWAWQLMKLKRSGNIDFLVSRGAKNLMTLLHTQITKYYKVLTTGGQKGIMIKAFSIKWKMMNIDRKSIIQVYHQPLQKLIMRRFKQTRDKLILSNRIRKTKAQKSTNSLSTKRRKVEIKWTTTPRRI